ncbi:MAG: 2-C-methyl-D-erythritol 2,4-cyclodiphosphate synthase [Oscillospiraceae bacterium]|jgi:2-C-methyl-D-erythritol 2,4-cyclodiphosphate synthase|nr:2-C-methyl-D-erythritol 2,4-cyclodiphosphate synthase [Oscillospiraceae bacterium]
MRIGHGYDAHCLTAGRRLVLGGVEIPHTMGLLGHSDADALTHALMDALLGAAALGDIGVHFPPSNPKYKDAYSLALLEHVVALLRDVGYRIENIDATIIAQAPRLASFLPRMAENIAGVCCVAVTQVSVKATTEDGMGFTGAGDGIAAHAVVLIEKTERGQAG